MRRTRRIVQFGFLALTVVGVFVLRGNAERWCPLGGVEALYGYVADGDMLCSLGITNFYILGAVLLMTLLVRRAFCAYMCPLGTISEWLRAAGARLGIPALRVPAAVDRLLGLLKYAVLAAILYFTWRAGELLFRAYDPCYALLSRHGADITFWAYVVAAGIGVSSLAVAIPFCRWLCPFAAVLNPFSSMAVGRVQRDPTACRDCRRCAEACPVAIPVDRLVQVTAARCLACMNCVEVCPERTPQGLSFGPPPWMGRRWPQAVVVALVLLCTAGAVSAAYLYPLPSYVRTRGTPPDRVATLRMRIENLTCRGRANLLHWFLQRDDLDQISGYLKLEAWPGPGLAQVQVTYDPAQTSEDQIHRAIVEPYFNLADERWWDSPFRIEGYHPLAGLGEADPSPGAATAP